MTEQHKHDHVHEYDNNHIHEHSDHETTHLIENKTSLNEILSYIIEYNDHISNTLAAFESDLPDELHQKFHLAIGSLETANVELQEILEDFQKNPKKSTTPDDSTLPEHTPHTHAHGHSYAHNHSPQEKKRQLNRLSRIIGHLTYVKRMIEADQDCADVLIQLASSKSALNGLGKQIINEHIEHCITQAIEDKNAKAIEEFQKSIQKFI